MNVTIVNEDKVVIIDGEAINFDFDLPSNVWAIQWNESVGQIEFNDGTPNEDITDFSSYQSLVVGHATEKQAIADAEAKAETDRIAAMTYADKRSAEYPAIGDQLDDIYHNGIDSWKSTIKAIKDKYPKG